CCRFAFAQIKHLLLSLRFRTDKTFVAVASLSRRAELPGGVHPPLLLGLSQKKDFPPFTFG
ncbi:hypothetical protein, partial [Lysinibacillus xylanilyticus]|uniref:hypothetical protein n=1 Tax=Lysinibacillus xylanilyticus TaxID=582475 RepID=UPI003813EF26